MSKLNGTIRDGNNPWYKKHVTIFTDGNGESPIMDDIPTQGSDNPVKSSGIKSALDTKQDTLTFDSAPTASSTNPVTSDGVKTALDAKADNSALATTNTNVAANATAITNLQAAYAALTQSDIVVVESADWPVSSASQNIIYRVTGTTSYSDYMWDGSQFVEMATYNNAIDATPTANSGNLVTSGGVFSDSMKNRYQVSDNNLYITILGSQLKTYYSISDGGLVTTAAKVQYGVVYLTKPLNQGTIIHFNATTSSSRKVVIGFTTTNPFTLNDIAGLQLTNVYVGTGTAHNYYVTVPYNNAYLVYYSYDQSWTSTNWTFLFEELNDSLFDYIGIERQTLADATKRRHASGNYRETTDGTRYSLVFKVKANDKIEYQTNYGGVGASSGVWGSQQSALVASSSNRLQLISSQTTEKVVASIISEGWLSIRFVNPNDSAITDTQIGEILSGISVSITRGLTSKVETLDESIGDISAKVDTLSTQVGGEVFDINNATKRRVSTGSYTESSSGTRYNVVFEVSQNDYVEVQSSYASIGPMVGVWSTLNEALVASSSTMLQLLSSNTTATIKGTIKQDGFLCIRFKNFDDTTAITDAQIEVILDGLTVSITRGIVAEMKKNDTGGSSDDNNNDYEELLKQAVFTGDNSVCLTLLHISDIHGDTTAASKINDILSQYQGYINELVCTGDVCYYYFNSTTDSDYSIGDAASHGYLWWTQTTGLASKALFVIGNHDAATKTATELDAVEGSAAWNGKGKEWSYDTYISPYASALGITQPTGVDDSSSLNYKALFWLKDYSAQKVRLIGLDCMNRYDGGVKHSTQEQETWLASVLAETLDSNNAAYGYSVIFLCHYPLDDFSGNNEEWDNNSHRFVYNQKSTGGRVMNHLTDDVTRFHALKTTAFASDVKFNMRNRVADSSEYGYSKGTTNYIGDIINEWVNDGGKYIAWLCGHTHFDYMWYSTKYPNLINIGVDKAGYSRGSSFANRESGNARYCSNFYAIDANAGLFKIVRFGLNINKQFERKTLLCYDYINKVVLNENQLWLSI